jgi:hypothetical protein
MAEEEGKEPVQAREDAHAVGKTGVRKRRPWVGVTLATLVGVAFTVAATWYQITRSEEQARLAELERIKSIRSDLVSIVEEHIINDDVLDPVSLARLIELRRREEGVGDVIGAMEIYQRAEFNILNTRYLEFGQKRKYKVKFALIYQQATRVQEFKDVRHSEILNKLAQSIQEGKTSDALRQLVQVVENYQTDMELLRTQQKEVSGSALLELVRENAGAIVIGFAI